MRITDRRIGRYRSEGVFVLPAPFATAEVEEGGAEPPRLHARESPVRVPETVPGVVRPARARRARSEVAPRERGWRPGARIPSRAGHVADPFPGPVVLFEMCRVEDDDGGARARAGGAPRREALA